MRLPKNLLQLSALLVTLTLSINALATKKLIFAVDIIRHGDRTPFFDLANSSSVSTAGNRQLTAEGIQQKYQLGVKMHKRYIGSIYKINAGLCPIKYDCRILRRN